MRSTLKTFLDTDSGAVVADWVVLTAAIVGVGISSANAVRSGVGNLGESIRGALSNASVAAFCSGSATYEMRVLTGDRAAEAEDIARQIGGLNDKDLQAAYAETAIKVQVLRDGNEPDLYVNEVLDYAALYSNELDNRRLSAPEGSASVAELAGLSGSCGSGLLGGGSSSGGTTSDYEMQILSADDVASFETDLAGVESRAILDIVTALQSEFSNSAAASDISGMSKALDLLYSSWQVLVARGDDRDAITAAQDAFNRAHEEYLAMRA